MELPVAPPSRRKGASAGRAVGLVGLCVVAAGLLINAYLVVVARNVPVADYKNFGAYWSLALVVGFGVFLPIEQELARLLQSPVVDHRAVLRAAMLTAGGFAVVELAVVLAASPLLLDAFGGKTGILAALGAMCLVSSGQFVVRGSLVGTDRMGTYGGLLVLDGGLRVVLAVAVAFAVSTDSSGYAWTLVGAVALVHIPLLPVALRRAAGHPGTERIGARSFARAVTPLLAGSLAAQLLLNGVPVLVSAVASAAEQAEAGQFQAAFLLARIPLFVAVPLQTAILPPLIRLFDSNRPHLVLRVISRVAGAILAVGVLGGGVAYAIGPWLMRVVFGGEYQIGRLDVAAMVVGVVAYLGLLIVTQALVASALHAKVAWSWLSGLAVAVVVFAVVPDLALRGELAFLLGSAVGCAAGAGQLLAAHRKPA
jgi:O-antigen/teichoic acid export membrane protein